MVDQTIDDLLAISCEDTDVSSASQVTDPHGHVSGSSCSSSSQNNSQMLIRPIYTPAASSSSQQQGSARFYPTLSYYLPPGDLTMTPRALQPSLQKYGQVPVNVLGVVFKIPYIDPLPDKFLRLNDPIPGSPQSVESQSQLQRDREFALLLHNEEFLQQAQINEEFMKTLNQDSSGLPKRGVSEDVSLSQKLSATGKVTREKLLKIAKKLNIKRPTSFTKSSSSSRMKQPLLDSKTDAYEPLLSDEGDTSLIQHDDRFGTNDDAEEEFKTIPRKGTIEGFTQAQQRARAAVAKQFHQEIPPIPPPVPPGPAPGSLSRCSTLTSDYHTLENLSSSSHLRQLSNHYETTKNLISLNDDESVPGNLGYTDARYADYETSEPIYEDPGELYKSVNSSLNTTTASQSDIGREELCVREIHSDTLSSSYFIPITSVSDGVSSYEDSEAIYDNITDHKVKDSKLINL